MLPIAFSSGLAIAAGASGTVVNWETNGWTPVRLAGSPLSNVVAISAGTSHALALRSDGTVVGWGDNEFGQASVPAGLTNVVAVAAGGTHSLALRKNGTIVEWGGNRSRWEPTPPGLTNVLAIAAGDSHTLVLRSDRTVVSWGYEGLCGDAPASLSNAVAIAAAPSDIGRDLAIRSDRTVVEWGVRGMTLTGERVPYEANGVKGYALKYVDYHVIGGLSNVVQIAAGETVGKRFARTGPSPAFSLAVRSDGTVFAWEPSNEATTNDTGLVGANVNFSAAGLVSIGGLVLSNVVAIAAGYSGLALKSDGTVLAVPVLNSDPGVVPSGLTNVVAIAARGNSYLAVVTNVTESVMIK
jgi:trimeric autotransporter adhesin